MPFDAPGEHSTLASDVSAFQNYLRAERGMAVNTVLAYGRDLDRFAAWVAESGLGNYLKPSVRELGNYLSHLRDDGLAPPSVARNLVALKMFFRFLRLEERTTESTIDLLSSPTLWDRIPQVLSPQSVEKLLAAPLMTDRFFLRDRALLETLYATGSRASEVVGLKLQDLYIDSSFCKCLGKGNKQRVIPLGRKAVEALRAYLEEQRPKLTRTAADAPWVFVSRGGKAADAGNALDSRQEVRTARRPQCQGQPAHATAQFRHAHARRQRRSAHGAGTARACQHSDDAAVHAC